MTTPPPGPWPDVPQAYPPPQGWAPYHPPCPWCEICGGAPAAYLTIRKHTGMIVIMQWSSTSGLFCRTCATALLREMTAHTLALGWWGPISFVIGTPFTLITNAVAAVKMRGLPPPGPHGPQLDPGRPLLQRVGTWVPVVIVLWMVIAALLR